MRMNKTLLLNNINFLKRVPLEGDEAFAYVELVQNLRQMLDELENQEILSESPNGNGVNSELVKQEV